MDIVDELTDLSGAPPHEIKAVADRAIKEIEKLRNKTRWLELVENTVVKQDKEIERLREALQKFQDDMKWWITQTEMRGITFARVTLEGGGGK